MVRLRLYLAFPQGCPAVDLEVLQVNNILHQPEGVLVCKTLL